MEDKREERFLSKKVESLSKFILRMYFAHKNGAGRFYSVSAKWSHISEGTMRSN